MVGKKRQPISTCIELSHHGQKKWKKKKPVGRWQHKNDKSTTEFGLQS